MILDVARFVTAERPYWVELEGYLDRLENNAVVEFSVDEVRRFHYLYQRATGDLARISTFAYEKEVRGYLEALVARAYGEIHEVRENRSRFTPIRWFFQTLPQTFRRQVRAFWFATGATMVGVIFGIFALMIDPDAKEIIFPSMFSHLQQSPSQRVKQEESQTNDRMSGSHGTFSAYLMQNNIRVSITVMALGATYGVGSMIMLFYNGVILGAVCQDYVADGQGKFLAAWLLPHGVIEIPAILLAGQAAFVLASAFIGWGTRSTIRARLRIVAPDIVTLMFGVAIMLVWAGIVESFLSQYHEPVMPYSVKIGIGIVELILLCLFLGRCGRKNESRHSVGAH